MMDETVVKDRRPPVDPRLLKDSSQWIGRRLGKYEITGVLGKGGMGIVLQGLDTVLERSVAIKVLSEELAGDERAVLRLLAEAKSAGQVNHPNTITIHEVAQDDAIHFLVMELAQGGSASTHLNQKGPYSVAEATRILIEACGGLSAAHQRGLIHRDIKPANLLLTEDGKVKVADFGLVRRLDSQSLALTQAGQPVGTPYYMSPEQCQALEVDARSDIYSLGATYYSLLTGLAPFQDAGSAVQVMFRHCNAERPDPTKVIGTLPRACRDIIQRAMATDPANRYQTVDEMRSDLEMVHAAISSTGIQVPSASSILTRGLPPQTKPFSRRVFPVAAMGALALVLGGLGLGYYLSGRGPSSDGKSGDATAPAGDANAVVPPKGEPIQVGVLHSLTGTMANSAAPVADATLLAIDLLNKKGGLLGRPVEAVVADARSQDEEFAEKARDLLDRKKVSAVFGCWTSSGRKTLLRIFEERDQLLFYPVQYEGIEESPNVFYTGAAPNQQILPSVQWAFESKKYRKFFLVGSDYVFPRVAHEIIKDRLKELGAELAGEVFLPLGSRTVQATIEKIRTSGADVILNSINGDTNHAFFAELRRVGITPQKIPTISFSFGEQELRHLNARAMAGDYASWNYFQSIDTQANQDFVSRFREKYGPQRVVSDPMEAAFISVMLWGQAVTEANSIDPKVVRRALLNQRMDAPEGEVRIDPATQHLFKTPRIGQVQPDGQFEVVWTASKPLAPLPYPPSRSVEKWRALLHELHRKWGNRWSAPEEGNGASHP
ncbi:MAG: transporter substrate-binding protein [Gemmataceae bacterium]